MGLPSRCEDPLRPLWPWEGSSPNPPGRAARGYVQRGRVAGSPEVKLQALQQCGVLGSSAGWHRSGVRIKLTAGKSSSRQSRFECWNENCASLECGSLEPQLRWQFTETVRVVSYLLSTHALHLGEVCTEESSGINNNDGPWPQISAVSHVSDNTRKLMSRDSQEWLHGVPHLACANKLCDRIDVGAHLSVPVPWCHVLPHQCMHCFQGLHTIGINPGL